MQSARVAGFAPETNGFRFVNSFPSVPAYTIPLPGHGDLAIGNAANGLCGGMVFAARDFFEARRKPPPLDAPPDADKPLFGYLVDRLVDSFDLPTGPLKYYGWMTLPDERVALLTRDEWPDIKRDLDAGRPCPLGLVRVRSPDPRDLGKNHQVLAFGYDLEETSGAYTLQIYDPNHPGDAVTLTGPPALAYSTGEPLRGFFRTPYKKRDPTYLLDGGAPPLLTLSGVTSALRRLFRR